MGLTVQQCTWMQQCATSLQCRIVQKIISTMKVQFQDRLALESGEMLLPYIILQQRVSINLAAVVQHS